MDEVTQTAWWVRRLGAAAGVIALGLVVSALDAREQHPAETPEHAAKAHAVPSARYGPDPNRRLSPQINRIIRVAQRSKLDEDKKGGATQFKSPPVQKKTAPPARKQAPVIKKQVPTQRKTAPTTRQKAPVIKKKAPVIKKQAPAPKKTVPPPREKAPVIKKQAPVIKKESPPPLKKDVPAKTPPPTEKGPPVEKAPPVETAPEVTPGGTSDQQKQNQAYCEANPNSPKCAPTDKAPEPMPGSTPEQQQENADFCAKNPNSPSCSKDSAPAEKAPQPTEKAPPAEKDPPAGEKEPQPGPGRPDEDAGGVGSICEQNPQLPQCQVERPDDTPPPPPGPGGPDTPPGAPPVPPGSPPPPPPSDAGDDTPPAPSGPTIQTVTECTEGQEMFAGVCRSVGYCPEGEVQYTDYESDPPQPACGTECPNGTVERFGACLSTSVCTNQGGSVYNEEECVEQCPDGALTTSWEGFCYDQCPDGTGDLGDGTCGACGYGQVPVNGLCADSCPEGMLEESGKCVAACTAPRERFGDNCVYPGSCPEGEVQTGGTASDPDCDDACSGGQVALNGACVGAGYCGSLDGTIYNGQCLEACPEDAVTYNGGCYDECPTGTTDAGDGTCLPCSSEFIVDGACVSCLPGQELVSGACADPCPENTIREGDQCVPGCPDGMTLFAGQCIEPGTCPEGELQWEDSDGDPECISRDECLDDDFMVERAGACIGWSVCTNNGGVIVDRVCLDQCPAGQEQSGFGCSTPCPEGQDRVGGECVGTCPTGQSWQDGQCADIQCDEGQELVGSACLEPCQEGEIRQEYSCVLPPCAGGQVRIDGVCTAHNEVGYEDFIEQCIGDLGRFPPPPDLEGATPRETCENAVDEFCDGLQTYYENNASDVQACLQRPCAEGSENVAGQCVPPCAADQERDGEGACQCTGGLYILDDGTCSASCPQGEVDFGGSCTAACAEGQVRRTDGTCAANCISGQVEQQDGTCAESCPEGQYAFENACVDSCPGLELGYDGRCWTNCPQDAPYHSPDGDVCLAQCGEGELISGILCVNQCPPQRSDLNGECVLECPAGYEDLNQQCLAPCPEGQVRDGAACVAPPPAGDDQAPPAGEGTPPTEDDTTPPSDEPPAEEEPTEEQQPPQLQCPEGQVPMNGACTAAEEVPYDDFIDECVASGGVNVSGTGGMTPEQSCEALVDSACAGGSTNFPPDSRICTERPCDEGLENIGGVCQAPGAEEQPPAEEESVEEQPPAGDQPPAEEQPPTEEEAPSDEQPPADDVPPPAEDEAPPADDEQQPPSEEDGDYGSICEQNPQFPQCQDQDDGEGTPPPTDGAPPTESAPPADGPPPATPPPGGTAPPIDEAAPPTPAKKPAPATKETVKEAGKAVPAMPLAVVIAIDDYDDKTLKGSPRAISNAAHVVRYLKDDLGLDGTRILTGRNATRSDFEDIFGKAGDTKGELSDLIEDTRTREVIVYFSGRALALNGGKDVVLLPSDAEATKPKTGVRLSSLYNGLARMGVSKLRLYLDTPFSDGDGVVEVNIEPKIGPAGLLTPRHWVTLSAARDTSQTDETDRPRSLFTESLIAGLRGIADTTGDGDGDGTVSAKELYDFVSRQAEAAAKRDGKVPMPSLYGKPGEPLRAY